MMIRTVTHNSRKKAFEIKTNYRKSVDQLLALLQVLDCEIDLVVREKTA